MKAAEPNRTNPALTLNKIFGSFDIAIICSIFSDSVTHQLTYPNKCRTHAILLLGFTKSQSNTIFLYYLSMSNRFLKSDEMAMDEAKKREGNGEKTVDAPYSRWVRRNSGVPVIKNGGFGIDA